MGKRWQSQSRRPSILRYTVDEGPDISLSLDVGRDRHGNWKEKQCRRAQLPGAASVLHGCRRFAWNIQRNPSFQQRMIKGVTKCVHSNNAALRLCAKRVVGAVLVGGTSSSVKRPTIVSILTRNLGYYTLYCSCVANRPNFDATRLNKGAVLSHFRQLATLKPCVISDLFRLYCCLVLTDFVFHFDVSIRLLLN